MLTSVKCSSYGYRLSKTRKDSSYETIVIRHALPDKAGYDRISIWYVYCDFTYFPILINLPLLSVYYWSELVCSGTGVYV